MGVVVRGCADPRAPPFERRGAAHKVIISFELGNAMMQKDQFQRRPAGCGHPDPPNVIDELIRQGKVVGRGASTFARAGIGRRRESRERPKPDIGQRRCRLSGSMLAAQNPSPIRVARRERRLCSRS